MYDDMVDKEIGLGNDTIFERLCLCLSLCFWSDCGQGYGLWSFRVGVCDKLQYTSTPHFCCLWGTEVVLWRV